MNVLLSSVGRRSYLVRYFKEALKGEGKVVTANCVAETTGMFAGDISEIVPPAKDVDFIESLLNICRRHKVKLLCSLHDWEAPYIAVHKQRFLNEGVILLMPEPEIIDVCLDKYRTWKFSEAIGIPSPVSFVDITQTKKALESGQIHFPLILKQRWGQGSIGMKQVCDLGEMENAYSLIKSESIKTKSKYLAKSSKENQIIFQQFIHGDEYGVDIVNDLNGRFVACFVKHKFAMRSGETDVAETVFFPQIEAIARKLAASTRHLGNMDTDFFVTDNNKIFLLEMNPRFGGGYPFSHEAGANVPAALIAWAKGEEPDPDWLKVKYGVRCFKDIAMVKT